MKHTPFVGLAALLLGACIEAPPASPSDPSNDMSEPVPDVSMPEPGDTGTPDPDMMIEMDMNVDMDMNPIEPDMPFTPPPFSVQFEANSSFGEVQNLPLFIDYFDERFTDWTSVYSSGATEIDRHYKQQKRVEFWANFPEIGAETDPIQVEFANRRSLISTTSPWTDFHAVWHMETGNTVSDVVSQHRLVGQACTTCRSAASFIGNALKTNSSTFSFASSLDLLEDDWSVTFWVMFDEINMGTYHVLTLQTDDNSIKFERRTDLLFVSGVQQEETAVPVEAEKWYFVSVNSQGEILVNGAETWVLPTRLTGSLSMTLGDATSPTAFDELWISKRRFSQDEVMTLYQNQKRSLEVTVGSINP